MSPINRDWNQLSDIEMPYKNLKDIVIGIAVQVALQVTIQLPPINIFLSFRDWGGSTNRPAPNHKFLLAVAASFSILLSSLITCSYARLSLLNIVCISVLTLLPDYMNGLLPSLHRKVITFPR